jgi:hypothetical protein
MLAKVIALFEHVVAIRKHRLAETHRDRVASEG